MKSILRAIIAPLFGIVIALGVAEVGFRLVILPGMGKKPWSDRPKIHFFPESSKSNRDYYYSPKKPQNTYRIVIVGDSFTYGFGNLFDDSFSKRLERVLNLNLNQPRVEVINLGTPGFSTRMEVQTVKKVVADYSPDLLILQITLNDPEIRPFNPGRESMRDRMGSLVVKGGVFDYWKSAAWIAARLKNARSYREYKEYFQNLFKDEETLQNFRVGLREIADTCSTAKVPLVGMVFPLLTFPLDDSYPFFEAHSVTHTLLDQLQVPWVDLFESFRGLPPERLQAEPGADPHPNEIAHRIAAEALYTWLVGKQLVPKEAIPRYSAPTRQGPAPLKPRE